MKRWLHVLALVLCLALSVDLGGCGSSGREDRAAGTWTELTTPGSLPTPRIEHSMVYDSRDGKVILFSGVAGDAVTTTMFPTDTWGYDPISRTWTRLRPGWLLCPSPRTGAAMVYDSRHGKVILYAGSELRPRPDPRDTWAYDPSANSWTELHPAGESPSATQGHSMAFDPLSGRAILFGGVGPSGIVGETWAYDPGANAWTQLLPEGALPSPRFGHSMVCDPKSGMVFLYGGDNNVGHLDDLWAYDPATNAWIQLLPQPEKERPPARRNEAMVYDEARRRVILYGGYGIEQPGVPPLHDMWSYDPAANTWKELVPNGEVPDACVYHALVYASDLDGLILFGGGADDWTSFNATWTYDLGDSRWTKTEKPGAGVPSGRAFHALFYDQAGDKVFSFGGYDRALDRADVWAYDLEAGFWTLVDPPGESPDPRENHAMVYDTRTRKALLFGGCVTTATFVNDTWSFDPASGEWAKLHPEGELPAARADHALVYDEARGKVILFGGYGVRSDQLAADTWAYDPSTNSWMDLNPAGVVPSARAGCAMVYDSRRGKVFLFGGCELEPSTYLNYLPPSYPSSDALLNDTWTYCPATNAWTKLDPRGESPPARAGHTLAYDKAGDKVYLFGGNGGSTYLDDIWVYDPSANRWGQLKSEGTRPPARTGHALVYDSARGRLILFGGFGTDWVGTYPLRDLWVYKPAP